MEYASREILDSALARVSARWTPPPPLTAEQWAEDKFQITTGPATGPFRLDVTPYLREPLRCLDDRRIHRIVFEASSQVGKSIFGQIASIYYTDGRALPTLYVSPKKEASDEVVKSRFNPVLRRMGLIGADDAKLSRNTLAMKQLAGGGVLYFGSAQSPSDLAARTCALVVFDEVDRYPPSAGTEGSPVKIGSARTKTYPPGVAKIVLVSSPTDEDTSPIHHAYRDGDQRVYKVPCPHCGESEELDWGHVHWEKAEDGGHRFETAAYACPSCGSLWSEAERRSASARGYWEAQNPGGSTASFRLNELVSPFARLDAMAEDFVDAKRNGPLALRAFINTRLGQPFDRAKRFHASSLIERTEHYDTNNLPADALVVTAGADIQRNRIELELVAWGEGRESWSLDYVRLLGSTDQAEVWEELDEALWRRFGREDGTTLGIKAACIDAGFMQDRVVRFCRERLQRWILPIKGVAGDRPVWNRNVNARTMGLQPFLVGADAAKDAIYTLLDQPDPREPGYQHFGPHCDEDYFRQLTAETRVDDVDGRGRPTTAWHLPSGRRNEALDCRAYAYAALLALEAHGLRLKGAHPTQAEGRAHSRRNRRIIRVGGS